jgi:hypothetical protein
MLALLPDPQALDAAPTAKQSSSSRLRIRGENSDRSGFGIKFLDYPRRKWG